MKRLIHNSSDGHSAADTKCIDQEIVLAVDSGNRPLYVARAWLCISPTTSPMNPIMSVTDGHGSD